jgi:predicted peptidase
LLIPPVFGDDAEIPKGTVVRSLPTESDPNQSYALFLPLTYSSGRKWPVLICFDPSARGYLPVDCFRQAGEKYGYIIAGSNNSRNGPMAPSQLAAQAVVYDLAKRLSIDERRVYMAGFSGGARVACRAAHLMTGRVAGVIGCAAGFSEDLDPSADTPFAFCGTVGWRTTTFRKCGSPIENSPS